MRIWFVSITTILLLAIATVVYAHTEGEPFKTDLIAGQHHKVGEVHVWNDDIFLHVKYVVNSDWDLVETHLDVRLILEDIPQKNGNPIPGKFTYKDSANPLAIPLADLGAATGDTLYIAAHAVTELPGESFVAGGTASITLVHPSGDGDSLC